MGQNVGTREAGSPGGALYADDFRVLDVKRKAAREDWQEGCSGRNLLPGGVAWSQRCCLRMIDPLPRLDPQNTELRPHGDMEPEGQPSCV